MLNAVLRSYLHPTHRRFPQAKSTAFPRPIVIGVKVGSLNRITHTRTGHIGTRARSSLVQTTAWAGIRCRTFD